MEIPMNPRMTGSNGVNQKIFCIKSFSEFKQCEAFGALGIFQEI